MKVRVRVRVRVRVIVRARLGPARISERKLTRPKVAMFQHAGFGPLNTNRTP